MPKPKRGARGHWWHRKPWASTPSCVIEIVDAGPPPWADRGPPRDRDMVKVRFPDNDCPFEHEKGAGGRVLTRCGQMWINRQDVQARAYRVGRKRVKVARKRVRVKVRR